MVWKSKKFWIAVSGVVAVLLSSLAGVPEETTLKISGMIIALILGQGLADLGKHANGR